MKRTLWTLKSALHDDSGAIIILWGLMLTTLIGAVGLGLETTTWYFTQRDLQKSTDSAAIAAAYAIGTSNANYQSMASSAYSINGVTPTSITVNQPPKSGPHAGDSNAIEVIATQNVNTSFSSVISNVGNIPISARSVVQVSTLGTGGGAGGSGGSGGSGSACVLALSNSTGTTITFDSQINVNVPGCVIASNSTSSQSILLNSNVDLTLGSLYTAGDILENCGDTINNTSANVTKGTAIADPFASLATPTAGSCTSIPNNNGINGGTSVTLTPGTYCNMSFGGTVTLTPSATPYIFTGGLNINSGGSITGNGVTVIVNGGITVGGPLNLTAPSSGTYAGIALFQEKGSSTFNLNSGGSTNITGIIYAPSATLIFDAKSPTTATCTKIVANEVIFNSGASFSLSACPSSVPVISAGNGSSGTNASGEALVE